MSLRLSQHAQWCSNLDSIGSASRAVAFVVLTATAPGLSAVGSRLNQCNVGAMLVSCKQGCNPELSRCMLH